MLDVRVFVCTRGNLRSATTNAAQTTKVGGENYCREYVTIYSSEEKSRARVEPFKCSMAISMVFYHTCVNQLSIQLMRAAKATNMKQMLILWE